MILSVYLHPYDPFLYIEIYDNTKGLFYLTLKTEEVNRTVEFSSYQFMSILTNHIQEVYLIKIKHERDKLEGLIGSLVYAMLVSRSSS